MFPEGKTGVPFGGQRRADAEDLAFPALVQADKKVHTRFSGTERKDQPAIRVVHGFAMNHGLFLVELDFWFIGVDDRFRVRIFGGWLGNLVLGSCRGVERRVVGGLSRLRFLRDSLRGKKHQNRNASQYRESFPHHFLRWNHSLFRTRR